MVDVVERNPQFVQVPGLDGFVCLWHFPSRAQLLDAAAAGCDAVVTLQGIGEDPNIKVVKTTCTESGMAWIQVDFWKNYYQHAGVEGHPALIQLLSDIAARLRNGQKILLHCAAGIHRTGMCIYGVLRRLGLTPTESLAAIKHLRRTTFDHCGGQRFSEMEIKVNKWFKI